jgi:general secretion pathway protein C
MLPKVIFICINLACITASTYVVVDGVYGTLSAGLTQQQETTGPLTTHGIEDADIAQRPLSAYNKVTERNLFNTKAKNVPREKKVDVAELQETKLKLKLWGTVSGIEDGDYAVIEDGKARRQNLYRVGDAVQTATVKDIFREKVILTVNGKDEILQMQEFTSGKGSGRAGGLPARSRTKSGGVRAQRISLRRSYIEQSMSDMASLMTQVQIKPHMEDGAPAGLALSSIKPNSIFRRMGLRNGDIITGVDGSEIASVDDALKMVEGLKSSSNLTVQLNRRGREKNIEYRIR